MVVLGLIVRDAVNCPTCTAPARRGPERVAHKLRLPGDRQIVFAVDHHFALSNPALVSAPSKKSFSNVSSPILVIGMHIELLGKLSKRAIAPNGQQAPPSP
jgi:hypothetical protein